MFRRTNLSFVGKRMTRRRRWYAWWWLRWCRWWWGRWWSLVVKVGFLDVSWWKRGWRRWCFGYCCCWNGEVDGGEKYGGICGENGGKWWRNGWPKEVRGSFELAGFVLRKQGRRRRKINEERGVGWYIYKGENNIIMRPSNHNKGGYTNGTLRPFKEPASPWNESASGQNSQTRGLSQCSGKMQKLRLAKGQKS